VLAAVVNSEALWYLTRGFGLITLLLLTGSIVLGISQIVRFSRPGLQRFVVAGLHRNLSLLAIVFLAVHIITAVADPYAPIRLVDAFVPFTGRYRPIWLGLGALATDLILVLAVSSLLRQRIGHKTWRAIHWSAYACWPVAVVHGLGTGSDTKTGWVQLLYVLCSAVVLAALGWRLLTRWSLASYRNRIMAGAGALALTAIVAAWAAQGPLRPGWSRRAGTPVSLVGHSAPKSTTSNK